jgi:oxygen-dependent protoporphyrinogen oxidase
MKRIAILGGGIAGVSATYELARQQQAGAPIEFTLFETTHRLGGIVETERHGGFVIECGPDSWVTEKPWARELAIELGLESEIVFSQDEHRKTYLAEDDILHAMPDGMRMMVPVEWASVLDSPLFSQQAKLDYLREPQLAEQLKATALDTSQPPRDESVRDFVIRHFGAEVADTIAAPLLAGVFGGDIATLSARAVLPAFVALEREHGSLILGLQQRKQNGISTPVFTTLRNGLSGLIEGMESYIPTENIRRGFSVEAIGRINDCWLVHGTSNKTETGLESLQFDALLIATPAKTTARLLAPLYVHASNLLPRQSSSAIVAALAFSAEQAQSLRIPRGFGFLVPQRGHTDAYWGDTAESLAQRALLACTFVDQKFPHRVPAGAVLLRAFFGGPADPALLQEDDATLRRLALGALEKILGKLPEPIIVLVRRWPDSLPLYAVGHLDRIAELESYIAQLPNVRLIGNAYCGVGLPDLIRDGRNAAREIVAALADVLRAGNIIPP